jgi:pentatricopeptide repeat protein
MYNSLLDGCAQNNLVDEGLRLLEEMQESGIAPSNFTLSVLVKMMSRVRRLDNAFKIVEQITTKYGFKSNTHVYTNLIQACVANKALPRAMSTFEEMITMNVQPESRTYSILTRACISNGRYEDAAGLLRGALGLPGALPFLCKRTAHCDKLDYAVVNESLVGIAAEKELALQLLSDIKTQKPKVRIDPSTQRRLVMCSDADCSEQPRQQQRRPGQDRAGRTFADRPKGSERLAMRNRASTSRAAIS